MTQAQRTMTCSLVINSSQFISSFKEYSLAADVRISYLKFVNNLKSLMQESIIERMIVVADLSDDCLNPANQSKTSGLKESSKQ